MEDRPRAVGNIHFVISEQQIAPSVFLVSVYYHHFPDEMQFVPTLSSNGLPYEMYMHNVK
jgi:hypothetical protein